MLLFPKFLISKLMIEKINDIMKNKEVKEMLKMYENFS